MLSDVKVAHVACCVCPGPVTAALTTMMTVRGQLVSLSNRFMNPTPTSQGSCGCCPRMKS